MAELCGKLLTKGRKVYLEGRLVYRTFTGRDNIQRTVSEIVLDDFIVFSDGRKMTVESEMPAEKTPEEAPETEEKTLKTEKKAESKNEEVNPDDIPF